jgi:hypothetical protein
MRPAIGRSPKRSLCITILLHSIAVLEGFCAAATLPLPLAEEQRLSEASTGLA